LLLNPYGLRLLPAIVESWTAPRTGIGEWGNVFGSGQVYAWTYAALACAAVSTAGVNAWHGRRFPGVLILLAATALQGFLHAKLVPYFVFTLLALGGAEFLRLLTNYDSPRRVADLFGLILPAGVAAASLTLIALQLVSGIQVLRPRVRAGDSFPNRPANPIHYPAGAVAFLAETHSPVNLWCPLPWGEVLSWSLYPNVRVSMDGRFETVFPASVRADHLRFWTGARDVSAASKYDTTHILVPAVDAGTLSALDASPWVRIHQDSVAVLYSRTATAIAAPRGNAGPFVGDFLGDLGRFAPR
jgi:hypothetical protein